MHTLLCKHTCIKPLPSAEAFNNKNTLYRSWCSDRDISATRQDTRTELWNWGYPVKPGHMASLCMNIQQELNIYCKAISVVCVLKYHWLKQHTNITYFTTTKILVRLNLNTGKCCFKTNEWILIESIKHIVKLKVKDMAAETNLWMDESTLNVNGARVREN